MSKIDPLLHLACEKYRYVVSKGGPHDLSAGPRGQTTSARFLEATARPRLWLWLGIAKGWTQAAKYRIPHNLFRHRTGYASVLLSWPRFNHGITWDYESAMQVKAWLDGAEVLKWTRAVNMGCWIRDVGCGIASHIPHRKSQSIQVQGKLDVVSSVFIKYWLAIFTAHISESAVRPFVVTTNSQFHTIMTPAGFWKYSKEAPLRPSSKSATGHAMEEDTSKNKEKATIY